MKINSSFFFFPTTNGYVVENNKGGHSNAPSCSSSELMELLIPSRYNKFRQEVQPVAILARRGKFSFVHSTYYFGLGFITRHLNTDVHRGGGCTWLACYELKTSLPFNRLLVALKAQNLAEGLNELLTTNQNSGFTKEFTQSVLPFVKSQDLNRSYERVNSWGSRGVIHNYLMLSRNKDTAALIK